MFFFWQLKKRKIRSSEILWDVNKQERCFAIRYNTPTFIHYSLRHTASVLQSLLLVNKTFVGWAFQLILHRFQVFFLHLFQMPPLLSFLSFCDSNERKKLPAPLEYICMHFIPCHGKCVNREEKWVQKKRALYAARMLFATSYSFQGNWKVCCGHLSIRSIINNGKMHFSRRLISATVAIIWPWLIFDIA